MSDSWISPPALQIDARLQWLLRAAFADNFADPAPEEGARIVRLARALEISARIAERTKRRGGPPCAFESELQSDYHTNLAVDAQLGHALERAAPIAARLSIPVIALKYAALRLARVSRPGTRVAADLDLLVPIDHAEQLSQALLAAGFSKAGTRAHAHQLEALVCPSGAVIELHLHVPGVRVGRERHATANELLSEGLVSPAQGSTLLVPSPSMLAAHALAHGLLQNRATPQSYSLLRMLADLADLRASSGLDSLTRASRFLSPPLSGLCEAAERLNAALARGVVDGLGLGGTLEQKLLWHCLAARLDADYARRLRAAGFVDKVRSRPGVMELLGYVRGVLLPPEPELDAIYGPAATKLARLRRRLWRPLDITRRAALQLARRR